MPISEKTKKREFVEKCLTTIDTSMDNCRALLVKQLSKDMDPKTELAIRKSYDALASCSKSINYYKNELEPEYCEECGTRIE